jgi:hypothetical protein
MLDNIWLYKKKSNQIKGFALYDAKSYQKQIFYSSWETAFLRENIYICIYIYKYKYFKKVKLFYLYFLPYYFFLFYFFTNNKLNN